MSNLDWLDEYERVTNPAAHPASEIGHWPTQEPAAEVHEVELGAPPKPQPDLPLGFDSTPLAATGNSRPQGRIVVLRSVSAGAGCTVLAANLAFELASLGRSVCLVDLDHEHPSLHRYFGIASPKAGVLAGVRFIEQGRFGAAAIDDLKVRLISKGVSVDLLAGVGLPQNLENVDYATLQDLLTQLAVTYQVVVVDAGAGLSGKLAQMLDSCAMQTLWVTLPDALSLGRFMDAQPQMSQRETRSDQHLVVNRLRTSVLGARPDWQVQQVLRDRTPLQLASMIAEDQALDQAMLQGLPLRQVAARSKALAAVNQLAERIA